MDYAHGLKALPCLEAMHIDF